ncbi:Hypothetical protein GLP15_2062 [Giardia lamblia P15]|uniref:Uncharacterized protein n=1 Tax=Giardia intestinalis (strain P15) TaxID=658858 RepID=E1F015_GIAIA|nr:Hypothetical protein GLP15_2062 [Giardia lamblia P15]
MSGEDEYEDDFLSYHSDFDPSSEQDNPQQALKEAQQTLELRDNAYTAPLNLTISQGTIVFSQLPMDYRKKCIEGICKEQFVRTLQQFVSRGTSTYRVTESVTRGVQVPSLLANHGFDQGGVTLAESLMTIALTGQIKNNELEDLPAQVRNKSILRNLNLMKEKLIFRGTRETKIGFLMEQCVSFSGGFIALIAVKLLEEELEESHLLEEGVYYPLNRVHMYQFLLISCDLSLTVTHIYTRRSRTQEYVPVDFILLPSEQDIPSRIVLFSQLLNCIKKDTTQPRRPYASNNVSILTVPFLEGFCEIPYKPSDNFSPPSGNILYRVAHRVAKNITVVGLGDDGSLCSWIYDDLNCEVSAYPITVTSLTDGIAVLSIYSISFSSRPADKNVVMHMTNGTLLVVQFMAHHALASEIQRLLESCSAISTVAPGTALNQNVYYNPLHTAVRSVKRIPHVTIRIASALYNGITCIQYIDGVIECFGSAINERLAVCLLRKDGLDVLMGPISEAAAGRIYKEFQD